jgi:hypothetical protein
MPLSEFERARIERLFGEYCRRKIPSHVRDQLRIDYKIRGNEVKLFECRPRDDDHSIWTESPVARLKKDEKRNTWLLYCADRNSKWHLFEPNAENQDIEKLLAEVERDSTGIFWG